MGLLRDRTVIRGPLWFVVPAGIDDPRRVSGGNVYDLRVRDELERLGWSVRTREAEPDAAADAFADVPGDGLVLVDGLVAASSPAAVEGAAQRTRMVGLVHMSIAAFPEPSPRTLDAEARALRSLRAVIVPSVWLRDDLVRRDLAAVERVVVAEPGADAASVAAGSDSGVALLCVGAVAAHKGQDTLVDALAALGPTGGWTCTFAGSLDSDRRFASAVSDGATRAGISERIRWAGVLAPHQLESEYHRSDLLVAPSRTESYGIAVGDALRRGIPVIASRVGGLPEAVRPPGAGMLVPPGDAAALEAALRRWVAEPELRSRMTEAARAARLRRPGWGDTARDVDRALRELA